MEQRKIVPENHDDEEKIVLNGAFPGKWNSERSFSEDRSKETDESFRRNDDASKAKDRSQESGTAKDRSRKIVPEDNDDDGENRSCR